MTPLRAVVVGIVLLVSACTSDAASGPEGDASADGTSGAGRVAARDVETKYVETECPEDVRGYVFGDVACGMLTVPADREAPVDSVSVFVTRIQPPQPSESEPILVPPSMGGTPNYLGISPLAQRTGREVIIVDGRGNGHSIPSLDCPEITASAQRALEETLTVRESDADYLSSVEACAARLRADAIEPSVFTLTESAADLAALRRALAVRSWVVAGYGNAARLVPELMRVDGDAVRAVVLDSPELPGMDPITLAVEETPRVIKALLRDCAQQPECRTRYPHAPALWAEALRLVGRTPLPLTAGALEAITLDQQLLLRVARQVISDGGSSGLAFTPGSLAGLLRDVTDRGGPWLDNEIAPRLAEQDPFCLGFLSDCLNRMRLTAGVYLTQMCHDIIPFAETLRRPDTVAAHLFTSRVNTDVCRRWAVGEADHIGPPVDWQAPTLVYVGRFSPYVRTDAVRRATATLPRGSVVVDPGGADNVLPRTECALELRTSWIANPVGNVETPPCLSSQRITWHLE